MIKLVAKYFEIENYLFCFWKIYIFIYQKTKLTNWFEMTGEGGSDTGPWTAARGDANLDFFWPNRWRGSKTTRALSLYFQLITTDCSNSWLFNITYRYFKYVMCNMCSEGEECFMVKVTLSQHSEYIPEQHFYYVKWTFASIPNSYEY